MWRSFKRIAKQAEKFRIFDGLFLFDEKDLNNDFKHHFKDHLFFGSRGYGYWSWKPEIILYALKKINDGDSLLYIDAGCHLNHKGKQRLIDYFKMLEEADKGIIAFQSNTPDTVNSNIIYDGRKLFSQPNYKWIKGDLLDHFNARDKKEYTNSEAIGAGILIIKKCKAAIAIIEEWQSIIWNDFHFLDDTPSSSSNLPGFIEHRHDQAIWSLLCLKHNIKTLSAYEYWYPKNNSNKLEPDWDALNFHPIHARRDKDMGILTKIRNKINKSSKYILANLWHRYG
jgi:hypothetical protein